MIHAHTVLIVHNDAKVTTRLAAKLKSAAKVSTATTFEQAKTLLAATPPAVLITGVRLGEYNGLHLIIRSRIDHPTTAAILISDRLDPDLEQEAGRYGAACVSYPDGDDKLLSLVAAALSATEV
jgi:DNA-binding NtrC family response regulator